MKVEDLREELFQNIKELIEAYDMIKQDLDAETQRRRRAELELEAFRQGKAGFYVL